MKYYFIYINYILLHLKVNLLKKKKKSDGDKKNK